MAAVVPIQVQRAKRTPRPKLVHQFLVVLSETNPLVWRRIQVPGAVEDDAHVLTLASRSDGWYAASGATQEAGRIFGYTLRPSGGERGLMRVLEGSFDLLKSTIESSETTGRLTA